MKLFAKDASARMRQGDTVFVAYRGYTYSVTIGIVAGRERVIHTATGKPLQVCGLYFSTHAEAKEKAREYLKTEIERLQKRLADLG